jgi:hypothetical protein
MKKGPGRIAPTLACRPAVMIVLQSESFYGVNVTGPSTTLPPWMISRVALVKVTLLTIASHLLFGQPSCFGVPESSTGSVVTLKLILPFLGLLML